MSNHLNHYDLVVLGSGAAGHHGAVQAAKLGKRVLVVEQHSTPGGACINTGTIPSKTLREIAMRAAGFRDVAKRINEVTANESRVFTDQFHRNGVTLMTGRASFLGTHSIRIEQDGAGQICTAAKILIATGSRPAHSETIPIDGEKIIDTDTIGRVDGRKPRMATIVGGGVIGIEYACIANALGMSVTLIERRNRILDFVDDQIVEALSYRMRSQGITFRLGEEVEGVSKSPDGKVCAMLKSGKQVWSDALLYAVGRQANTDTLNLETCGLQADSRGRIPVNEAFQTSQPHIYAAGDVIGFPSLASVSMEQGRIAACHAFGEPAVAVPELFPYGIYSIPEISFVGQTEAQLTAQAVPYEIGIAHYREIARGQILNDTSGLLKLLFHRENRKLLGVHIVGEGATELIHIGQTALAFDGTIDFFIRTVFNYPTLAECYKVAALNGLNRLHYSGARVKAMQKELLAAS